MGSGGDQVVLLSGKNSGVFMPRYTAMLKLGESCVISIQRFQVILLLGGNLGISITRYHNRRELPGNYPIFTMVMVIHHYAEFF